MTLAMVKDPRQADEAVDSVDLDLRKNSAKKRNNKVSSEKVDSSQNPMIMVQKARCAHGNISVEDKLESVNYDNHQADFFEDNL